MGALKPSRGHGQEPKQRIFAHYHQTHYPLKGRQRAGAGLISSPSPNAYFQVFQSQREIEYSGFSDRPKLGSSSQLSSCVTSAKVLNLSEPRFPHLKMGITAEPTL